MDDKKITQQESITIITEMISRTKQRYIGDGNIMLMWGWLTIAVSAIVWTALVFTKNPQMNWLWFLIPLIGGTATPIMAKKSERDHGVKTYSDKISSQIWLAVGLIAIAATIVCMAFGFAGIHAWNLMFIYALIIVPLAEIVQGLIVREKALVIGGAFGIALGLFTTSCIICHITLYAYWFLPTFMLAFTCMMLIPGYVMNHKAQKK